MFRRCAFHINIANSCTINTGYTESAFNHYRRCNLKSEIHSNKSVKRVKGSKSPKPKMYFLYFSALFARNSKIYWNKIFLLMFCKPLMKYQALFRSSSLFLCYPLARRQGAHAKCLWIHGLWRAGLDEWRKIMHKRQIYYRPPTSSPLSSLTHGCTSRAGSQYERLGIIWDIAHAVRPLAFSPGAPPFWSWGYLIWWHRPYALCWVYSAYWKP